MTTATLGYYKIQKNLQAKIQSVDIPAINWKVVCITGFFVSLSLIIFYVWQINSLMQESYLTSTYEKQISQLSEENRNLQVSFAESSFLGEVLVKIGNLNFQKVIPSSVRYINTSGNSAQVVATNKNI